VQLQASVVAPVGKKPPGLKRVLPKDKTPAENAGAKEMTLKITQKID
jgi:hypothetical protein